MSIQHQKQELRTQFKSYREQLSDQQYASFNRRIRERLAALPEVSRSRMVHSYWSLPTRREIDIRPLIQQWHAEGKTIVLPVMRGLDLLHVPFEGTSQLAKNSWGLYEPTGSKTVPVTDLELVVVPALGASRRGHRIGYGKGYYDRFLADVRAVTVGLVFDACLKGTVPVEPHDVPLDIIVTENEVIRVHQPKKMNR